MATHIIWDWNGTLLDDVTACVDAINEMLAARQLPCISRTYYRDIFDFPVKGYYERLGFDLATEDWDAMANEFHLHYGKFSRAAELRPATAETLGRMRDRGLSMSILSASEITLLERTLEARGIRHFFDHVVGLSDRYAASKLDKGKLLMAALGIPRNDILLVGDTNHDHEVAETLGIDCVLLTGGHQSEHRLATPKTVDSIPLLLDHAAFAAVSR
jgi:phosphoglycolate phosphatase